MFPADDRHAVGMVLVQRGEHLLAQPGRRRIVDPLAPLLQDHIALHQRALGKDRQVGHAVGFKRQHQRQAVDRNVLEIGREVPAGERILLTAVAGDQIVELALRHGLGAEEHQMFQKVGDARHPRRLVGRPDPIPQHVADHGRAAIGHHHDFEAVVEDEGLGIEDARVRRRWHRRGRQEHRRRNGPPAGSGHGVSLDCP